MTHRRYARAATVAVACALTLAWPGSPAAAQAPPGTPSVPDEQGDSAPPGIDLAPTLEPSSPSAPASDGPMADQPADDSEPGFFDIGGRIREAINGWFRDLVASALSPTLELLGRTVLATPQVTGPGRVAGLWGISAGLANAFFVLFALAGGVVVMSHETVQTRYSAKEIAPRLVIGVIAANASLALAGQAIAVANALSQGLLGQGVAAGEATAAMRRLALAPLDAGSVFLVFVGLVAAVLALVLLAVYVIRVACVVLLVAGAPLALACHALPNTEGFARLWWRAFTACLGVQVAQSLVLIAALRVFFTADGRATLGLSVGGTLVDLLVVVCLLWVLLRIPSWAGRMVFTGGRGGSGGAVRTVRHYIVAKAATAVKAAA